MEQRAFSPHQVNQNHHLILFLKTKKSVPVCTYFIPPFLHLLFSHTLETKQTNLPPDGVLVFTERDIFCLSLVPFKEQIQALVGHERIEEALMLLDGVQSRYPLDSYKVN